MNFKTIKSKLDNKLNEEHSGAVAFEYIIILVIMVVAIFTVWKSILSPALEKKAGDIASFIQNNGQGQLGGTGNNGNNGNNTP